MYAYCVCASVGGSHFEIKLHRLLRMAMSSLLAVSW